MTDGVKIEGCTFSNCAGGIRVRASRQHWWQFWRPTPSVFKDCRAGSGSGDEALGFRAADLHLIRSLAPAAQPATRGAHTVSPRLDAR